MLSCLVYNLFIQSAIGAGLPSHETIWTSGNTVDKGSVVLEGGIKHTKVNFSQNGNDPGIYTNLEFPTLHVRYGVSNTTEVFSNVMTTTVGLGIKQELLPIDDIHFSLQSRAGVLSRIGTSSKSVFGGVGGEIVFPFIQSSVELIGTGSNLSNDDTNYSVWIETGNQIPVFSIGNTIQTNLIVHYAHPLRMFNQSVEYRIINEGGGINTTYVVHSSIQTGISAIVSDALTVYGLFSTVESFGTVIATSQSGFQVLPPWAQTKDNYDIDSNRGFNLIVSYQF